MKKENVVYTHAYIMEYYLVTRKKDTLPLATTYMDLEDITLSEISQTKKKEYCMISFMEYKSDKVIKS